ncbi:MAG TPA: hypothetical protein PLY16_01055 [Candidatus Saccharibacteria bacterium]|nr:hypothetical protein [Candidatus Saccharibacteria bacterium]
MNIEREHLTHDELEAAEASRQRSAESLREAVRIVLFQQGITISDRAHRRLNRKDPVAFVSALDRRYEDISDLIYQEAEARYEQQHGLTTSA